MAKSETQEKDRFTLLAEAAYELNEALGLEPKIPTEDVSIETLEEKLEEACLLIREEDEFTEQTEQILPEFMPAEEEAETVEADEEEAEPEEVEGEEAEEEEEFTLYEIREFIEDTKKRKDLRVFAEDFPDVFPETIENLPELKTGQALKEALLEEIDEVIAETEEDFEDEVQEMESEDEDESEEESSGPKKKRGVIATIAEIIETAGQEGVSKDDILEVLVEEFPNREADSMKNTINVQVPTRISKERFSVERNDDGKYYKAE